MTKRVAAAAFGAALLMPLLASAHHAEVRDGNDTRGVLDIKRAEIVGGKPPTWKVTTWQRWSVSRLWDRGFILVYVDTFGSSRADYYALVASNGRRLVGTLYRDRAHKRDVRVRSLRTRHPRGNVVKVTIPMRELRRRASKIYRWYTLTMLSGKRCKRFCFDRAPDDGQISEPGPAPSATPSLPPPTPTPTITP